MPEEKKFNTSLNCGGNQVGIEISVDETGTPRIDLIGICGQLDEDNKCGGGDYCLWMTRLENKSIFNDGLNTGMDDEKIIDLDPDDT